MNPFVKWCRDNPWLVAVIAFVVVALGVAAFGVPVGDDGSVSVETYDEPDVSEDYESMTTESGPDETSTPVETTEPPAPTPKRGNYTFDGQGANVSAAEFGPLWPLTLSSGRVNCSKVVNPPGLHVVFTADDYSMYALNGTAMAADPAFDYKDVSQITKPGGDVSVLTDICAPMMN